MSRALIALACVTLGGCATLRPGDVVTTPKPWVHRAQVVAPPDRDGLVELSDGMLYAVGELHRVRP